MSRPLPYTPPCLAGAGQGAEVFLLPERAVFWPAARTLLVADPHWGKCETFRAAGAPLPQGLLQADLTRLSGALRATEAERLIVLGDLLHAAQGITDWLVDEVRDWRARHAAIEFVVVPGNHDRRIASLAEPWGLILTPPAFAEGPFLFTHDPAVAEPGPARYAWAGHIHPMATLRGRGDWLRLPAFHLTPAVGVLPAFSAFTDGVSIQPEPGDALMAIAPDGVFRVR